MTEASAEPLEDGLAEALARPAAHPHDPDASHGIETLQTHLSWVFLTRGRVYKLRKAVRFGFVDFGSREARNADCLREVALNRRLAPDVYLGVAPVLRSGSSATGFQLGPVGEALGSGAQGVAEHCVVMRRLPAGRDALSMLATQQLTPVHLEAVARVLARFHPRHAIAPVPGAAEWRAALQAPMDENFRHLAGGAAGLPRAPLDRLAVTLRRELQARRAAFESRRLSRRIVDGHGDLHLQHLWFEEGAPEPVLIDCLEFDAALRRVDTASEVAFLAMDLLYRGRGDLAEGFLARYAEQSDDFGLYDVVDWFASYRATVRAKVASLAAEDVEIERRQREAAARSARRHVDLAETLLAPRSSGALVVMCGSVGSGKSSVAARLAGAGRAVVISSDRTRKQLAGLAPEDRAAAGERQGLYDDERTAAVYAALLERAGPVVGSGRIAILDATFARRQQRLAAASWARERGVPGHLVEVRCDPEQARQRLERRRDSGRGASDAGPELLNWSLARFESPDEWEPVRCHGVDTSDGDIEADLRRISERLPIPWHRNCIPSES